MFSHVANRFGCENFGLIGGGDVPRGIEGGKKKKKKRRAIQGVSLTTDACNTGNFVLFFSCCSVIFFSVRICLGVLLKFARVVQTRYLI